MTDAATHIRRLFLEPKESYSVRDAAEILCMPLPDVLGWMEVGELEGVDTPHGVMLSWGELASFGMDFWSQEAIESALGADLADAIPELLRLADPGSAHPPPRDPGPGTPRRPRRQVGRRRPRWRTAGCRLRELGVPGHGDPGLHRRASVAAVIRAALPKRSRPVLILAFRYYLWADRISLVIRTVATLTAVTRMSRSMTFSL